MQNGIKKALACAALALGALPGLGQAQATDTRYPVVLVHGLLGFDSNILTGDYFYGIPADLRKNGARVFVPEVSAINSNAVRGEQLLKLLRQYKATYGYSKFNLIGHSQGGGTSRYVASVAPDLVASVTSVGTPHDGSPAADLQLALGIGTWGSPLGTLITTLTGNGVGPNSVSQAATALSTAGSRAFNDQFPAGRPTSSCGSGAGKVNGITYYSVGGTSVATNILDVSDVLLVATNLVFQGAQNDGLVGRCSSHWGTVLKDNFRWNHLDQVNQVRGLRGLFSENPVSFYRSHVNRLKNEGL